MPRLSDTARRETLEETAVPTLRWRGPARLVWMFTPFPRARKGEPFHLHHDLIFVLRAGSDEFLVTEEAPRVAWCGIDELARHDVPANIFRAASRLAVR
jgi:8-oxo-dGTP pyrophosphatase MutT (NUDIX family)